MKDKLKNSFYTCLRIWGSAWIAMLISFIPLYIWRGSRGDEHGENLLIGIIGMIAGFIALMLLQTFNDKARRIGIKDTLIYAGGGIGIYLVAWVLLYLPNGNNYLVAVCGYHFGCVLGMGEDMRPTFPSSIASALIFGLIYFFALLLGTYLAHLKHSRFTKGMKKE